MLLRPLGDVVVLMPPLTITADEIVRMVDALDGALDEVTGASGASGHPSVRARRRAEPVGGTDPGRTRHGRRGGRWRSPREFDALGPAGVLQGGAVVSFASNDYLGLSAHPAVVAAAHEALDRWGAGSGASRLVTGSRPIHGELERALAEWKGTEAAVYASRPGSPPTSAYCACSAERASACSRTS